MNTFIFSLLLILTALAEDRLTSTPLRTIEEVHKSSKPEKVLKLSNARVAIVDYDLLRLDFPVLKDLSNDQVDNWLLSQVAFISEQQGSQAVVNSEIPLSGETRIAKRPPEYGRAIVFEMNSPIDGTQIGLIDAKGTGANFVPHQGSHGNGLATLGECLREYNYENAVKELLAESGSTSKTVGSYGVIDAGFDVVHADGSRSRAGFYLRQAHSRPTYNGWLDTNKRNELQKLFHRYGIDPNHNIQGTTHGDIYDFGHYVARDDLSGIDPKKQIPFSHWGYDKSIPLPTDGTDTRWYYSKLDRPWLWAHETAEAFANGNADRDAIWKHHRDMVGPVIEKLKTCNSHLRAAH
jgi:hypothetical protein